eukprot:s471_g8.t1
MSVGLAAYCISKSASGRWRPSVLVDICGLRLARQLRGLVRFGPPWPWDAKTTSSIREVWLNSADFIPKCCTSSLFDPCRGCGADHVKPLCEVFKDKAADSIIPLYLRLLTDAEVEVRTVAAARVADAAAVSPTKEFLETLMPALERLTAPREQSQHVRASLAGSVLQLCAIFGKQLTVDYLINIVLQLIRDETPEVRLQLISTLEHLSSTVGVDVLAQSLLPSIKELGKDRQWRVRLSIIKVMPDLAKPDGLMALCRRRALTQLPWTTAVVSAAFAIGLLVVHVTYGCVALAVWGYFFGYYVLKSQSSPYPLRIRVSLATALLLCTSLVTAAAWLFFGGLDGCRAFDPEMKTSFGYKFDQFWTLLCFRHAVNWFLTLIGICLVLADHPQSTYIRDCIRCLLSLYTSQIVSTLGNTLTACAGADENNDGVRDSFLGGSVSMQESPIAGLQVSGRLLLVLSGNWFLQIVVKMMRALEAAFEEPLPCFRTIVYLKYFVVTLAIVMPAAFRLQLLFLLGCFTSAFALVVLTLMEFLALRAPLRALQRSLHSRTEFSGAPSEKMQFAASTLRRFQVAVLLSNSTLAFYGLVTALSNGFVRGHIAPTVADYSSLLNAVGLAIGLVILTGSLNAPELPGKEGPTSFIEQQLECTCGRFKKKRWSLQDEDTEPVNACATVKPAFSQTQVGQQMGIGKTFSQVSAMSSIRHWSSIRSESRKTACQRCSWDEHVKEIAGRRMSVDQLLDFYAKLGPPKKTSRLHMVHFDPARSTTTDVVRHVVIPESRCGDTGKALAEVVQSSSRTGCLPSSSSTVRMVTHHWANRFRDLVAAVLADSLGLKRWDSIADELSSGKEEALRSRLHGQGSLDWEYWICAFCINQHASICDVAMGALDTVTGEPLPTCNCATPKYLNDSPVQCELNKFDSMMAYLHHRYHQRFLQVVATDKSFNLFSRAWCIAELVQAHASRMEQHVVLHSHKEIEEFNRRLQQLLLGSDGLFAGWKDAQALLLDVGAIAARAKTSFNASQSAIFEEDLVEI